MKDWIKSNQAANLRSHFSQGCSEGDVILLHVPVPFALLYNSLRYISRKFKKNSGNRYYASAQTYRISVVCDGNSIYMSFTNLVTGLSANIYSADIVNAPVFNLVVPEINFSVETERRFRNANEEFSIVVSPEIFGIITKEYPTFGGNGHQNHYSTPNMNTIESVFSRKGVITSRRLPADTGNYSIALCAYTGNRPFHAVKAKPNDPDFIEYRRTKSVSLHYGVESPLLDQITPNAMVGIKPSHARWLWNKASKTSGKVKGELIVHFTENSPMFVGVSPGSNDYVMDYDAYGKGGARGKYREYSCTKETQCTLPRDSISTKTLSRMVRTADTFYIGTTDTTTVMGYKKNNTHLLWEHTIETCGAVHPELESLKSSKTIAKLKCDAFALPNVLNRVKLPSFFVGYNNSEEDDLTEDEAKILMRWWNDHVNSEILAGRTPTKESKELFERIKKLC